MVRIDQALIGSVSVKGQILRKNIRRHEDCHQQEKSTQHRNLHSTQEDG
jgi:hypothetical protein